MGIVIIYHMEVTMPASWHSLNQAFTKVVECDGDLHVLVSLIGITVTQKHHLIVVGEVIVGDGYGGGAHDGINKAVGAVRERAVVHPHVAGAKNGDAIPISHRPPAIVGRRATDHGVPGWLAIMDVEAVDDDVGDELDSDAGAVGDVHVGAAAVDGLEAVHDELLLEGDDHVTLEHDPEGLILDDGMPQCPRARVHRVVVPGVGHLVQTPVAPADGVAAEADAAVGQPLAVEVPVGIAAPAVVDGIACSTGKISQGPASGAVPYGPAKNKFALIVSIAIFTAAIGEAKFLLLVTGMVLIKWLGTFNCR